MLDEKDLQAIAQLLAQQRTEIMHKVRAEMAQQRTDIIHEVSLLMENYFDPKFNALADGLEILKEKSLGREELEEASDRLDVVEAVIKIHSREIEKLKKAQ